MGASGGAAAPHAGRRARARLIAINRGLLQEREQAVDMEGLLSTASSRTDSVSLPAAMRWTSPGRNPCQELPAATGLRPVLRMVCYRPPGALSSRPPARSFKE